MMAQDIYASMHEAVVRALRSVVTGLADDVIARVEVTPARDPSQFQLFGQEGEDD